MKDTFCVHVPLSASVAPEHALVGVATAAKSRPAAPAVSTSTELTVPAVVAVTVTPTVAEVVPTVSGAKMACARAAGIAARARNQSQKGAAMRAQPALR